MSSVSVEAIRAGIARTAEKIGKRIASWIDEGSLPPLMFAETGETLDLPAIRYMMYRQSQASNMRPDAECQPLYALIDRKTSGDFALALLRMYLGRKQISGGRWAMAIAGILGDDRVVPVLMQQIRTWVAGNHVVLAQSATEALGVLGSDAALCAVDAIALKFRTRNKVAKAANEALALAAESQGITVDELGDRIVPWLGFEPGKLRVVEYNGRRIEVRIELDFKLAFWDAASRRKIASLPTGVPAEIKAEYKDLGATLREVVKGQIPRIEDLMVRQYQWRSSRWKTLFLMRPVLFPFAVRLVWGIYASDGSLRATFRALEDGTLTNECDECVELHDALFDDAAIGVVHPLELSSSQRVAWHRHLSDYNILAPFTQLERPVIVPEDCEKTIRISMGYQDIKVNGMTFRGRLDRLGWQRGPIGDGAMIMFCRKHFLGCSVDAIIELDGLYLFGTDVSISLGRFYFSKAGTVGVGESPYDAPEDDNDPRLINFGDVPPVVYSETLSDLSRVAGQRGVANEVYKLRADQLFVSS